MPNSSKPETVAPLSDSAEVQRKLCRGKALDLLGRREHSRLELERKLASRFFEAELIGSTLDGLEDEGLLVTSRFVEDFIRGRALKGKGPVRIRAELLQRGIGEHETKALLAVAEFDWSALASEVRAKRFGAESPENLGERARQVRFLRYRGFETAQINAALDLTTDSD